MASGGRGRSSTYEILLKILIIGDTGSKKTELLMKYASGGDSEEDDFSPTICNGNLTPVQSGPRGCLDMEINVLW